MRRVGVGGRPGLFHCAGPVLDPGTSSGAPNSAPSPTQPSPSGTRRRRASSAWPSRTRCSFDDLISCAESARLGISIGPLHGPAIPPRRRVSHVIFRRLAPGTATLGIAGAGSITTPRQGRCRPGGALGLVAEAWPSCRPGGRGRGCGDRVIHLLAGVGGVEVRRRLADRGGRSRCACAGRRGRAGTCARGCASGRAYRWSCGKGAVRTRWASAMRNCGAPGTCRRVGR